MAREKHDYNYPVVVLLTNAESDYGAQTEEFFWVHIHLTPCLESIRLSSFRFGVFTCSVPLV
jgi:hypothetical protein